MKLSRKWLSDFTDIQADNKEYADRMTLTGSKVEVTEEPGARIKKVVVGKVTEMIRHENSDHLWVCTVDVGGEAPVTIVTGAQNLKTGDICPVALHKSHLPGGVEITKGKLRGVMSEGMLCSLQELELDLHDFPDAFEDGILVLTENPEELVLGADIRPIIGKDDSIVEFEITNNRPDCFSVIGLARESAVTFDTELKLHEPVVKGAGGDISDHLDVDIAAPDLCPRYTARMVRNIKIAPSPKWMRQRLRASGVRPINNIVDITNYVMLEYGQPMHAFDYSCIRGGKIVVRRAGDGEVMNTLDGTRRTLTPEMLVIADAEKAVGIAGVMGGENSEITEKTEMVVFESANFNGTSVRKTAIALGMRTDASTRNEKGLDPTGTLPAVQRALELIEQLGAGEVIDGVIDVIAADPPPKTLPLEPEKINKLLGTDITEAFMTETLEKLGFTLNGREITVPAHRLDIDVTEDIAEEVARFYGYNVIAPTMIHGETAMGGLTEPQRLERETGATLRGMGFDEIITYSFVSPNVYDRIRLPADSPLRTAVRIQNPLGEDTSIMRTMPLPSMLEVLARNNAFRNTETRFYELAKIYLPDGRDTLCAERVQITLGAYGGDMDFYRLKGVVEALLRTWRVQARFETLTDEPYLHPGRGASVTIGGDSVGFFGQIHPLAAKNYDMDGDVYYAQLDFEKLRTARGGEPEYMPLPKYPAVDLDLAVVCGQEIEVQQLINCIEGAGGPFLEQAVFFDVYQGAQVPAGKKSVAFSLKFRSADQTLTDDMANAAKDAILAALQSKFSATIR